MSDELISVGEPLPRIDRVETLDGRKVRVYWRSGKQQVVDLAPTLFSRRIFIPLREDDALFRAVCVEEDGIALEWPGGIDLSANWLAKLPPLEFDNFSFREAMDELGMSLEGMAAALDISRRQVADYRKEKPIPRTIAFATRYLVEVQRGRSVSF